MVGLYWEDWEIGKEYISAVEQSLKLILYILQEFQVIIILFILMRSIVKKLYLAQG